MRLRQAISLAKQELRSIHHESRVSGGRDALIAQARHDLKLDEIDSNRIAMLELRLSALEAASAHIGRIEARLGRTEARLVGTEAELRGADAQLRAADAELRGADAQLRVTDAELRASADALANVLASIQVGLAHSHRQSEVAALGACIEPVTTWIRAARLANTFRITVLMATHNRCELLPRAVDSVRAQEYSNWELVIVDDGSSDGTSALLERMASEDERIVVVPQSHLGVGTARNAGLSAATGDVMCYLDDDNTMQPLWLKAVAWAFERQPGLELLYGARVMDVDVAEEPYQDALPFLHFEPFDRRRLEVGNFIDLGVIAHLRALPEARFDESLKALGDWDLLLRLTAHRSPLPLPVVASIYSTSAPNRISQSGHLAAADAAVRLRIRHERPLRVLAYNLLFPLVPETYIAEEMKGLTDNGAVLAWCTDRWSPSPVRVVEPTYTDLHEAVREFEPDVLMLYWASFAVERLEALSRLGKPFALRVHSFDFVPEDIQRVRTHPLCIGVWAYPHHAHRIEGAHDLVPLLTTRDAFPEPAAERPIVLSASAGLPKKDWPTLVAAFAELARKGVDCRIVVGITEDHEDEPDRIRQLIEDAGASIMLSIDVPHDQVIELLARTAVVVYTKRPGGPFGMPRSIIEGMYAGTSVILPDRPEAPLVAGLNCRTYAHPEDIVRHSIEVLSGGPEIEAERQSNRRFVERHFAEPSLATSFAAQLMRAVSEWRAH
jgi:glycosyltransferase involved in cell wall biosynthesis